MNSAAEKIVLLSHKFFAPAATEAFRGTLAFSRIKWSDVDEVHRVSSEWSEQLPICCFSSQLPDRSF